MENASNIESYINENTKLIWVETPTNPTLKVFDIEELCKLAKQNNMINCI